MTADMLLSSDKENATTPLAYEDDASKKEEFVEEIASNPT